MASQTRRWPPILRKEAAFIACASIAISLWTGRADALQPLAQFVSSARSNNPDNREASAIERQRAAQRDAATGAFLPALGLQGTYTHNEYEATITLVMVPVLYAITVLDLKLVRWERAKPLDPSAREAA